MLLPLLGAGVHSQFLVGWGDGKSLIIPFLHGGGGQYQGHPKASCGSEPTAASLSLALFTLELCSLSDIWELQLSGSHWVI